MTALSLQELMPPITDDLLQEITDKIVAQFAPEKVVLFGSRAWGTPRWDSDIDLLVVMESELSPIRRAVAVRKAARPRFVGMDVIVHTPTELETRLQEGEAFLAEIVGRGRVLYERPA